MWTVIHGFGCAFLFNVGIDDGMAVQVDDDVMVDGDNFLEIPLAYGF